MEDTGEGLTYSYNASGLVAEIKKNNLNLVTFFYNDRGHRVRKDTYDGNGINIVQTTHYVRDVSGSVMGVYTNSTLVEQPIYGSGRIAVHNRQSNNTEYELTDHLGNVRAAFAVSGGSPDAMNATDYYPYGMPMPGRNLVGDYRYAFQGQEKDPGTGKEAFELRLWDSRIGRWLTTDPYGQYASPYLGMGNNPISLVDPNGGMTDCPDCPDPQIATVQLDEVVVTAPRINSSWNTESMYWSTTFQGNLSDWNALNGTNFTDPRDAFDWYKQQEWNAIKSQHWAEFYAGREAYGRGVIQLMSALTLPVSFAELGTAAVIYSGSRTALSFSDDIALLSDDIVQYSIKSIPRAPRGGILIENTFYNGGQFIPGARTTLNFGRQTQNFSSLPFGASTLRPAVHATLSTPALNGATGVGLSSLSLIRYYHKTNQGN
ncbi:RHS repeat-associated core domain-containing protein [Arenibacter sp. GZD96]|uniref:RHS repeat-associated core domain-containing protein n=1 Tax=Aurantibrevibacter litoralis TaxID=3106030 RepID=UPI002B00084D|nr:RHS repeat-associated core domain-containing protein [Arenibacter sp. GZD-96]MEA1786120.1 RHS repeat-associated core domain-containing protein [Arenibacter sp. GZD-96]